MSDIKSVPSYRRHKQSGQAIVTLSDGLGNRRDVLLGKYRTRESRQEYARVIAQWEANGRDLARSFGQAPDLTVNELILAYWRFAERYYRGKNGRPSKQLDRVRRALRPAKELYGHALAADFGPLALKACREWMINADWTRGFINSCVGCIKRAVKWGVENELLPPSSYHALQAVSGLKRGRTEAREVRRIRPVPDEHVAATLPFMPGPVQAMVRLQRASGMRPCEVVMMRPCDVDRRPDKTWVYRPEHHKTEHHDIERVIFLGPQAQAVLQPYLERDPGAYCFSPRESMAEFRARQREQRKTNVQPSQLDRSKKRPRKQPGECYTVDSYRRAIDRACVLAERKAHEKQPAIPDDQVLVPRWHPNQLRHSTATEIRREAGLDAARVALGHRSAAITEVYAEIDQDKAAEVMAKLG